MEDIGVQRRLAAVLAADVAGYTRQMEANEHATVAAWRSARSEVIDGGVADHGGRIVKLTGDGFLAEFPTVQDAVRCAVDMQTKFAERNVDQPSAHRMAFRMGVNLGDIFVDTDDIYGDGVNIAARLESIAEPGGICVSGSVFDQVEGKLDRVAFRFLGNRKVKNITKAIRVYAVSLPQTGEARALHARAAPSGRRARGVRRTALWVVGLALLAVLVVSPLLPTTDSQTRVAMANSVAVLSFRTIGDDQHQGSFSDGLTEDLITTLAGSTELQVVYAGAEPAGAEKAGLIQDVARGLNTRYVLEGSVHGVGQRVRMNARLIDATTGYHLWAGRYDREMIDPLSLQDEVTSRIARSLSARLTDAETERRELERAQDDIAGPLLVRSLRTLGELLTNIVAIPMGMWDWLTNATVA